MCRISKLICNHHADIADPAGIRITKNTVNSGGTSVFNVPVYVAAGFFVSFDAQFGRISTLPADGFSFVLGESASASTIPVWACAARGGSQCFGSVSPRYALVANTYSGAANNYFRLGTGAVSSGLTSAGDANIINVQFLSTATFGSPVLINANDRWSFTLHFQPGGGTAFGSNQVSYSITRNGATQSFTARVDINAAINAAPTLGNGMAWLGFLGASGGSTEEVWITNVNVRIVSLGCLAVDSY